MVGIIYVPAVANWTVRDLLPAREEIFLFVITSSPCRVRPYFGYGSTFLGDKAATA